MNADGLHLSRLSKGHMESLNRIAKNLKKNDSRTFSLKDFTNNDKNDIINQSRGNRKTVSRILSDDRLQLHTRRRSFNFPHNSVQDQ